jgi:histidinol-phosphatase
MSAWSEDLALAFSLADGADTVSMSHYHSEDLTTVHKVDGTPVSQVDFDTEHAMLGVLDRARPADAVVGEEVGPQPGNAARRWILDGIDGTHNFSLGRPG